MKLLSVFEKKSDDWLEEKLSEKYHNAPLNYTVLSAEVSQRENQNNVCHNLQEKRAKGKLN